MPFTIEPSVEIAHRYDFALLANARGLTDAVEVGVDQGVFARDFLSRFEGHWMFLVDPYDPHDDFPHGRMGDLMQAVHAMAPYHGRCRFVMKRSPDCIPFVTALIKPDFVYIDAEHTEEACYADMVAWWDILPSRAILAGHDYDPAHPAVMRAVERFARERDAVVRLTAEAPPVAASWYIYRTEPPVLVEQFFRRGERPNTHARA
jgi:hypothetical protein